MKEGKFSKTFEKAIDFALKVHKWKYRSGNNLPYFWHPMSVAKKIQEIKGVTNLELLMTVAILHDTVEEWKHLNVTIQEIREIFWEPVASLVDELTSDPEEMEKIGRIEYLKRKMENMSDNALIVKLADRLHNVEDIITASEKFQMRYNEETTEILDHLESWVRKLTYIHIHLIAKIRKILSEKQQKNSQ